MAENNDIQTAAARVQHFADKLEGMAGHYGHAKQTREYDSDRRKACLAKFTLPFLADKQSATAAETKARTTDGYAKEMASLAKQFETAETTIATWQAVNCQFEASRSLLSMQKSIVDRV